MTQDRPAPTATDLLQAKAPVTVRDYFGVDPELNRELADAKRRLERAQLTADSTPGHAKQLAVAKDEVERAKAAVRDSGIEVVARSIGRDAWEKLRAQYPPTKQQIKEYQEQGGQGTPDYDYDRFPVPAIAASLAQPEMTEQQVAQLWNSPAWNDAECARLFEMALLANTTRQVGNLAF